MVPLFVLGQKSTTFVQVVCNSDKSLIWSQLTTILTHGTHMSALTWHKSNYFLVRWTWAHMSDQLKPKKYVVLKNIVVHPTALIKKIQPGQPHIWPPPARHAAVQANRRPSPAGTPPLPCASPLAETSPATLLPNATAATLLVVRRWPGPLWYRESSSGATKISPWCSQDRSDQKEARSGKIWPMDVQSLFFPARLNPPGKGTCRQEGGGGRAGPADGGCAGPDRWRSKLAALEQGGRQRAGRAGRRR
jgi:hypothetical protein